MLKPLPPAFDYDNPELLKQTVSAARALGILKGTIATIPNEKILLDTLVINEAKSSSAIENIVTTYEELYIANIDERTISSNTKEAKNYADAVKYGYELIRAHQLLTLNTIIAIQKVNAPNYATIRKIPGTVLVHQQLGQTVYTPPQSYDVIVELLGNLEKFINDSAVSNLDPLIKMAIIHYQFESIHPFHDGNGRMGRILNILYLSHQGLLSIPVLYLSEYIIENKNDYYRLLQDVRDKEQWLEWCVWLIKGVEETAYSTINKIDKIKNLMQLYKTKIRKDHKFYSQDLINILFRYPYTKIEFVEKELKVSRPTATRYLETLADKGYLNKQKLGRDNFYFNTPLFKILIEEKQKEK